MNNSTFRFIILAFVLLVAQVVVFNHICLFGVAVPFVFIYLIIRLPINMPVWQVLTIAFFMGLTVDVFADTPGLNSLACTVIAMMRRGVLRLYFNREDDLTDPEPSLHSLGMAVYMKYMLTMVFIYATVIFAVEGFVFFYPGLLVARVAASTILTWVLLLAIDSLTVKDREKRL